MTDADRAEVLMVVLTGACEVLNLLVTFCVTVTVANPLLMVLYEVTMSNPSRVTV